MFFHCSLDNGCATFPNRASADAAQESFSPKVRKKTNGGNAFSAGDTILLILDLDIISHPEQAIPFEERESASAPEAHEPLAKKGQSSTCPFGARGGRPPLAHYDSIFKRTATIFHACGRHDSVVFWDTDVAKSIPALEISYLRFCRSSI
jgi:hypothetical protein